MLTNIIFISGQRLPNTEIGCWKQLKLPSGIIIKTKIAAAVMTVLIQKGEDMPPMSPMMISLRSLAGPRKGW